MGGTGIMLKDLLRKDRPFRDNVMSPHALIFSSEPWALAVICTALITVITAVFPPWNEMMLFRAVIVYACSFSLISSSLFQVVFSRFIADRLQQKEYASVLPGFLGVMALGGAFNLAVSAVFMFGFTSLDPAHKVLGTLLFCIFGFQWMVMMMPGIARDFFKTSVIFLGGFFCACAASGAPWSGSLPAFIIGQAMVLVLIMDRVTEFFPMGKERPFEFIGYFGAFPSLIWTAALYNLGFWIDKFILWYSPWGFPAGGSLRSHIPYDTASLLAALTIFPGLFMLCRSVKITVYHGLKQYFSVILNKGSYDAIEQCRQKFVALISYELSGVFRVQSLVTLIAMLMAPSFLRFTGLESHRAAMTAELCLLGSFFQFLFFTILVIFWTLELQKDSLRCVMLFCGSNALFTCCTLYLLSPIPQGAGYMMSALLSFLVSCAILRARLKNLNYITFMRKPLQERQPEMPPFRENGDRAS